MKIGTLFHNKKKYELATAIALALTEFRHAEHTLGYQAGEVRLNPADMPEEKEQQALKAQYGLPLKADPQVRPNHIRVCTVETLDPVQEEFQAGRAEFARQVAEAVRLA